MSLLESQDHKVTVTLEKLNLDCDMGLNNGSMVKRAQCSSRQRNFKSQHSHQATYNCL